MTDRPTITIELPITKSEVILKEWITGREYEETQKPIYDSLQKKEELNMQEFNHSTLLVYVVSVGGSKEMILDTILDLPFDDYNFIIKSINDLKKKIVKE